MSNTFYILDIITVYVIKQKKFTLISFTIKVHTHTHTRDMFLLDSKFLAHTKTRWLNTHQRGL